jgi:hypothetical protein
LPRLFRKLDPDWLPGLLLSDRRPIDCVSVGGDILHLQGDNIAATQLEALAEANLHPDWVAGISIGSSNGAIIAGNPPNPRVAKLRTFWEGITNRPFDLIGGELGSLMASGDIARGFVNQISAAIARRRCLRVLPIADPQSMVSVECCPARKARMMSGER